MPKKLTIEGEEYADKREEKAKDLTDKLGLGLFATAMAAMLKKPQEEEKVLHKATEMAKKMGLSLHESGREALNDATRVYSSKATSGLEKLYKLLSPDKASISVPPMSNLSTGWSPFYSPLRRTVNVPKMVRDSVIAHELGHAMNDQVMRDLGPKIHIPYHVIETASRTLGSSAAVALAAKAAREKDPSYKNGLLALALTAPMLAEEAAASIRAGQFMMKEHGKLKGLAKTLPLLPAFATYAAVGASPLIVSAIRKRNREKAKEKNAMSVATLIGFRDELEKIAKKEKEKGSPTKTQKFVGAMGGSLAAPVAAVANKGFGSSLHKGEKGLTTSPAELERARKHISPNANVHIVPNVGAEAAMHIPKGGSSLGWLRGGEKMHYELRGIPSNVVDKGFESGMNVVPQKAGVHVGAHELGHDAFRRGAIGKGVGFARGKGSLAVQPMGAAAALMAMGDPDSTASKVSPWIGAAAAAPTLIDEGAASINAIRGMRRAGFSPAQMGVARKQLGKAFGTYAAATAPLVAAPLITRQIMKSFKKRNLARAQAQGQ